MQLPELNCKAIHPEVGVQLPELNCKAIHPKVGVQLPELICKKLFTPRSESCCRN